MDDDLTQEDIARRYKAAIGSVTMLDAVAADPDAFANDETIVQRNVEHLTPRGRVGFLDGRRYDAVPQCNRS